LQAELAGMRATGTLGSRKALVAEYEAKLEALERLRRVERFQAEERGRAAARVEVRTRIENWVHEDKL
jgi:hypothetical protein